MNKVQLYVIIEEIEQYFQSHHTMRLGQSVFNVFSRHFPNQIPSFENGDTMDCFYNDNLIPEFIVELFSRIKADAACYEIWFNHKFIQ